MVISALISAVLWSNQTVDVEALLQRRNQFDSHLIDTSHHIGYLRIGSEMLGGAHGDALYPIGYASERYMISFLEANMGGELIYEKQVGSDARIIWHVPIVPSKRRGTITGTIPKYLRSLGFEISRKARITAGARKQLSTLGYFANYSFHPMSGGFANVIKPSGEVTKVRQSNDPFSITPEEVELLKHRWSSK